MVQNHLVELVKQQFKSQNAVACIFVFIAITNFVAMAAYASQQQNIRWVSSISMGFLYYAILCLVCPLETLE